MDNYATVLNEVNDDQFVEVIEPFNERILVIRAMKLAAKIVLEKELQYVVTLRKYKHTNFNAHEFSFHAMDLEEFEKYADELKCEQALEEWNTASHAFMKDYNLKTNEMKEDLQESIINLAVNEANRHARSLRVWQDALDYINKSQLNISLEESKELVRDNRSFNLEFNIETASEVKRNDLEGRPAIFENRKDETDFTAGGTR